MGAPLWLDGELVPASQARVSPLDHALHYGTGVFEGIRCYAQEGGGGGVFRLREHLERMHASARIVGFEIPWSVPALEEAVLSVLRASGLEAAYVRPLAWLGEGSLGVGAEDNRVRAMVACWSWGAYFGDDGARRGVRVAVTGHERGSPNVVLHRAKATGQYLASFLAKRQARALGVDEALLTDRDGYLCEGSGENLFLVRGGELVTPPDSAPILLGITRASVLDLARDLGIPARLERFGRSDLYAADEAFLTGTAAEVTPLREADGRSLRASPGPVTEALRSAYLAAATGRGPRAEAWVTRVEEASGR